MSLTVSYGSLGSFLDDRLTQSGPGSETTGLCLVAGGIVASNLEDTLKRQAIPTAQLSITTIEDTARTVLDAHTPTTSSPVELLDPQLCQQLLVGIINDAPESSDLAVVDELLAGFDWAGRPTLRETLWNELDRYFRMTDAGGDHEAAQAVARELAADDPYAGRRSQRALEAFAALHDALEDRTESLAETMYLSRSHLVSAARKQVEAEWASCYPDVEWIALDTVAVLDNPTLRFFETLGSMDSGPDIYVFGSKPGAGPTLYDRLASTRLDPQLVDDTASDPHVAALMEVADGKLPESVPNTQFIEAPDARRELSAVASQIRELTQDGASSCGEIVVAAKDVIPYRNQIEAVFRAHGLPTHIQARRPLMQTGPYRYLTAVCKLLAAAETDEPVTAHELVDPLRLGFCPPETATPATAVTWPLDGQCIADIETWIETSIDRTYREGQPFAQWAERIRATSSAGERPALHTLVEFIETASTPASGQAIRTWLGELLDAHSAPLAAEGVRRTAGPGIDDTRLALTATHDTHIVQQLTRAVDRLGTFFEQAVETGVATYCWRDVTDAVRQLCGGASYWPRAVDGNAVRIVNAANAHYRTAEYVFVVGLGAEEFPAERSPPTLFHDAFYRAIRTAAAESDPTDPQGYLHAPTDHSQFDGDLEEYRAALSAASKGVWLCRQYRSRVGEPVPWSGFVDAYTATLDAEADALDRIRVDEWLPSPHDDPQKTVRTATPRDRLGLLCGTFSNGLSSTVRPRQSTTGLADREAIAALLSAVDGAAYRREIEPRRERYSGDDLDSITVQPADPAADDPATASLTAVAGPPTRSHELDLYANCPLKYYFRQYLDGGGRNRDEPTSGADSPPPRLLDARYPDPSLQQALRRLIESPDRLANRQSAFDQFASIDAFRDQLTVWIDDDQALAASVMQPMLGEYQAVQQELAAGIDREWRWEPAQTVEIGGHELTVPGHRVDALADHGVSVPVWYTGEAGAAQSVVEGSLAETTPVTERDHRLLAGAAAVDPFGGALVYDPTSSAALGPHGIVVGDLSPVSRLLTDTQNLTQITRAVWADRQTLWTESATTALAAMTAVDEPITYQYSESFVANGGCDGCVYRDLCGVPASQEDQ